MWCMSVLLKHVKLDEYDEVIPWDGMSLMDQAQALNAKRE